MLADGPPSVATDSRDVKPSRKREPMRDIDKDHPVDPKAEEHGGRPGRRGRKRRAAESHQAERHEERRGRWQGAADEQPHAPEDEIQKRQNQRQRPDAVQDALPLDDCLGFERDAVPARERDLERRPRLVVVRSGRALDCAAPIASSRCISK